MKKSNQCPCGSDTHYQKCCGRYIDDHAQAPTAEALMRSRYTAYTLPNVNYLSSTWELSHCPKPLALDKTQHWIGLKILNVTLGTETDSTGSVEFIARYKIAGRAFRLHEVSRFIKVEGSWLYVNGEQSSS